MALEWTWCLADMLWPLLEIGGSVWIRDEVRLEVPTGKAALVRLVTGITLLR